MSWSVSAWKEESLEKHSFSKLCFPICVRGNWWWFCCRRKQLWARVPEPTLQGQSWPRGCTKQMCTSKESPAKHKRHKVGFVIAALIATICASLQWNYLPDLGFGRDTRRKRSQTLHCAPGNGHKDVSLDLRDTHRVTEKSHQWA